MIGTANSSRCRLYIQVDSRREARLNERADARDATGGLRICGSDLMAVAYLSGNEGRRVELRVVLQQLLRPPGRPNGENRLKSVAVRCPNWPRPSQISASPLKRLY